MPTVRYFAAAAEAADTQEESLQADTLGELLQRIVDDRGPEMAQVLGRCSILHDGRYLSDPAAELSQDGVVDVLPPFAGG